MNTALEPTNRGRHAVDDGALAAGWHGDLRRHHGWRSSAAREHRRQPRTCAARGGAASVAHPIMGRLCLTDRCGGGRRLGRQGNRCWRVGAGVSGHRS